MTNFQWHDAVTDPPTKEGCYLVYVNDGAYARHEIMSYSKDLFKEDPFDFWDQKGEPGWYTYDDDWGHTRYSYIRFWMELPEPPSGNHKE